jgi:predicted ArsR family transcriptional regulator
LPDTLLAKALSSQESWKILNLLVAKPLSGPNISGALGISARSAKAHLAELVNAHLVDAVQEELPSGKEEVVYKIAPTARTLVFPPRNYEYLSEALISGLVSSLGEKSARLVLRDIGMRLGEQMGRSLLTNTDSVSLTMKEYGELVVKRLLASEQAYPRIVSQKDSELVYEQFNCPFQELADKMSGLICDVLDESVHDGLDKALNVKTIRLACKAHGDATCRFRVVPLS